jgi:hypothetical protein
MIAEEKAPGIASGLVGMLNVFVDPAATAKRVPAKLSWLWPLIVFSIIYGAVAYLMMPYSTQFANAAIAERSAQQGLKPEQIERAQSMAHRFTTLGAVATPVILIVGMLILAWLVSVTGAMTGARAKFRNVFSLMASCSLIQAFQSIAAYIVVRAKGDEIHSAEQLTPPFGLDIFLQDVHGALYGLVNFFSIFEIWYLVVLTVGLAALAKTSKGKAFAAITPAWVLPLLLRIIQMAFSPGGSNS